MANESKKYVITFSPKDAPKSRFVHREFDTKADALKGLRKIKNTQKWKANMLNPRIGKNRFYKIKKGWKKENLNGSRNLLSLNIIWTKGKDFIHLSEHLEGYGVRSPLGERKFKTESSAMVFAKAYMRKN